jgi:hypothetical protein
MSSDESSSSFYNRIMPSPSYLEPYLRASEQFGEGFGSLLWASPKTQAARFNALAGLCNMKGKRLLDAGCGRADFLDFLVRRDMAPENYVGIEAVEATATAARKKQNFPMTILQGDFVLEPNLLDQRADIIIFCGSLNTLSPEEFYLAIETAWQYAKHEVAFNFLSSGRLAKANHLNWHHKFKVMLFVQSLSQNIFLNDRYIDGDCTIAIKKSRETSM